MSAPTRQGVDSDVIAIKSGASGYMRAYRQYLRRISATAGGTSFQRAIASSFGNS
jgi:hypothetical protein